MTEQTSLDISSRVCSVSTAAEAELAVDSLSRAEESWARKWLQFDMAVEARDKKSDG